ncbi:MAG: YebC/PmpR family DNA-binding transcriptional regulator, partial [Myxococcales bacterium]|nr:YebC/PmpR family DNA-binding transcriptional regulator [Myxococcales bacterium]
KGVITAIGEEEEVMMTALDAGAEDVSDNGDGSIEVLTEAADCEAVVTALTGDGIEIKSDEIMFVPDNRVAVSGKAASQLLRMLDMLDDCDDVQGLTHNADFDQASLDAFANS